MAFFFWFYRDFFTIMVLTNKGNYGRILSKEIIYGGKDNKNEIIGNYKKN